MSQLPEILRPKPGRLSIAQQRVYEVCFDGSLLGELEVSVTLYHSFQMNVSMYDDKECHQVVRSNLCTTSIDFYFH